MTEQKKENYSPTLDYSSTTKLADNEFKLPVGSVETIYEKEYNPYEHRKVERPNTFTNALMHLLKSCLGTGILAVPSAVAKAGIIFGFIGTIVTGILCTHTIHLLIFASQQICKKAKVPSLGFPETAEAVFKYGPKSIQRFSRFAGIFVEVALLLTHYAATAVYVVFISRTIQELVTHYHHDIEDWPVQYFMLIIMIPLIIFVQIRDLKQMVYFSVVANTTMVVAFVITFYYMFSGISKINMDERKLVTDVSGIPKFFSTVMFAMEGIGTMLAIENSMVFKQQFIGCPGVLNTAMVLVTGIFTFIGLFGYLRFGDHVSANVIDNLDAAHIAAQIAKACIAVAVFFTFMLQFYVPCSITWRRLNGYVPEKHHNIAQIVLRTCLVIVVTGVAASVPKLDAIIGLVGSIFLSILGLFIPAVIDIVLNMSEGRDMGFLKWKLWKNMFVVVLSWFALISGSFYAIQDLIADVD